MAVRLSFMIWACVGVIVVLGIVAVSMHAPATIPAVRVMDGQCSDFVGRTDVGQCEEFEGQVVLVANASDVAWLDVGTGENGKNRVKYGLRDGSNYTLSLKQ